MSAISAAGAEVLRFYFGKRFTFDVTSESLAGVTRHFTSFSAAAQEAGLSRIYAGQHFRSDHIAGKGLGRQVAESVRDAGRRSSFSISLAPVLRFSDLRRAIAGLSQKMLINSCVILKAPVLLHARCIRRVRRRSNIRSQKMD
jgi:hypothetical protein